MRVPLQRCNTQKKNGISLDIWIAACGFSTSIQSITGGPLSRPFSTSSLSSLSCYVVPWPVDNARENTELPSVSKEENYFDREVSDGVRRYEENRSD